jgi:hypothetical protein
VRDAFFTISEHLDTDSHRNLDSWWHHDSFDPLVGARARRTAMKMFSLVMVVAVALAVILLATIILVTAMMNGSLSS